MNTYYPSDRYWKAYPLPYLHVKLAVPMPSVDDLFAPATVTITDLF